MKISERFETKKEFLEKFNYWKGILGLNDWIIKAVLVDEIQYNEVCEGISYVNLTMKAAEIKVRRYNKDEDNSSFVKHCEEATLVHELLHCILDCNEKNSQEEHIKLEFLSRSFVISKYNLPLNYFDNTLDEDDDF